jgi:hypothetical protein
MDFYMTGLSYIGYMLASVLVSQNGYQKIFRSKDQDCQGLVRLERSLRKTQRQSSLKLEI